MNGIEAIFGGGSLIVVIIVVVWAVLWFFVPFYISTMNRNMKKLVAQNNELINILKQRTQKKPVVSGSKKVSHQKDEWDY